METRSKRGVEGQSGRETGSEWANEARAPGGGLPIPTREEE
jgi:hypothetical protein